MRRGSIGGIGIRRQERFDVGIARGVRIGENCIDASFDDRKNGSSASVCMTRIAQGGRGGFDQETLGLVVISRLENN